MTMITPSYLGETIEYSSLHACRSTLEDPTSPPPRVSMTQPKPESMNGLPAEREMESVVFCAWANGLSV